LATYLRWGRPTSAREVPSNGEEDSIDESLRPNPDSVTPTLRVHDARALACPTLRRPLHTVRPPHDRRPPVHSKNAGLHNPDRADGSRKYARRNRREALSVVPSDLRQSESAAGRAALPANGVRQSPQCTRSCRFDDCTRVGRDRTDRGRTSASRPAAEVGVRDRLGSRDLGVDSSNKTHDAREDARRAREFFRRNGGSPRRRRLFGTIDHPEQGDHRETPSLVGRPTDVRLGLERRVGSRLRSTPDVNAPAALASSDGGGKRAETFCT